MDRAVCGDLHLSETDWALACRVRGTILRSPALFKNSVTPGNPLQGRGQEAYFTMPRLFHPLLLILANATHRELAAQVQYLKAENAVLRSKLPRRVTANRRATAAIDWPSPTAATTRSRKSIEYVIKRPPCQ
jgi:hypothetical protein